MERSPFGFDMHGVHILKAKLYPLVNCSYDFAHIDEQKCSKDIVMVRARESISDVENSWAGEHHRKAPRHSDIKASMHQGTQPTYSSQVNINDESSASHVDISVQPPGAQRNGLDQTLPAKATSGLSPVTKSPQ